MRPLLFTVLLTLLLLGNGFAAYKLFTAPQEITASNPKVTAVALQLLQWLPVVNIAAIAGMFFRQKWAAILVLLLGVFVLYLDIRYQIRHHIYVALPSLLIMAYFIRRYWGWFR